MIRSGLHAWIVMDRDHWKESDIRQILDWAKRGENRGLALSNPCFEFWLLMHFRSHCDVSDANDCGRKLKNYLPNYDKNLSEPKMLAKLTKEALESAIANAKRGDPSGESGWPQSTGTTVYLLVEKIMQVNAMPC